MVVTGRVDGQLRALVRVPLAASPGGSLTEVEAWIDTAFNGSLTLPRSPAAELELPQGVSADAVLADGSQVELESFVCYLNWFGETYRTQAVATDGAHPLLGTQLLAGRRLVIDYVSGTIELT